MQIVVTREKEGPSERERERDIVHRKRFLSVKDEGDCVIPGKATFSYQATGKRLELSSFVRAMRPFYIAR